MRKFRKPSGPLSQQLKGVPVGADHRVEHTLDEFKRHARMEEIAHRVDEDQPRSFPLKRLIQTLRAKLKIKPALIWMARDATEPFCECLGIAVGTPRANLRASRNRIPGCFGPLYG
jgi:hypothetical protein